MMQEAGEQGMQVKEVVSICDFLGIFLGTNRYFQKVALENNLKVIFVDCTKPKCLEAAITPDTKLVWLETPTNPTLKVIDIKACADIVHRHPGVLLAVDNSFMSAYFQVCHLPQGRGIGKGVGKGSYQDTRRPS
ncbi:PREDICTED: cystathionine gamma-lyase-like [Sturnus vulgaris]|uniref:cystathionine gamma-lyase-like n=1 Tax=Sturnus vulgaris TaxID=9172 RepID=UPI00071A55A8|nr:PREDICTED: cystathionine gamma-lyase-like [Sturnus vulgaris]